MKARLSIQQFELELSGETASGRVVMGEASGSNDDVRTALRAFGRAITEPRARRTDIETSHAAAAHALTFIGEHERVIYQAIKATGEEGATYREIARRISMEPVAVARRLADMERRDLIERRYEDGKLVKRDGCAVWKAT